MTLVGEPAALANEKSKSVVDQTSKRSRARATAWLLMDFGPPAIWNSLLRKTTSCYCNCNARGNPAGFSDIRVPAVAVALDPKKKNWVL
jgi:hypothetical protein